MGIRTIIEQENALDNLNALLEEQKDDPSRTLIRSKALRYAIELKNQPVIEAMLNTESELLNDCIGYMNETPIMISIQYANWEAFSTILAKNPELDIQIDLWGTALTTAAFLGKPDNSIVKDMAKTLVKKLGKFDSDQHPGALLWAIKNNNVELVKEMCVRGADINSTTEEGFDEPDDSLWQFTAGGDMPFSLSPNHFAFDIPLKVAIKARNQEIVKTLINYQPDLDAKGFLGKTPRDSIKSVNDQKISQIIAEYEESTISGELLTVFDEMINNMLIATIADNSNENAALLSCALSDSTLSAEVVGEFGRIIDPLLYNDMMILYGLYHQHAFYSDIMLSYRKVLENGIIKKACGNNTSTELVEKKLSWLVNRATIIIDAFLTINHIRPDLLKLTEEQEIKKQEYIKKAKESIDEDYEDSSTEEFSFDEQEIVNTEKFEKGIEDLSKIASQEGTKITSSPTVYYYNDESKNSFYLEMLPPVSSKLWKSKIYPLIGSTPTGRRRNAKFMHEVLAAIFYKQTHNCRWRELPQNFPSYTRVLNYYYKWRNDNVLSKIEKILLDSSHYILGLRKPEITSSKFEYKAAEEKTLAEISPYVFFTTEKKTEKTEKTESTKLEESQLDINTTV